MVFVLTFILFIWVFSLVQGLVYLACGTTPVREAEKQLGRIKQSSAWRKFAAEKRIALRKMGAGVLLKDQMTVSQWYLYKAVLSAAFGMITYFITGGVLNLAIGKLLSGGAAVLGWFVLDVMLRLKNKSSNDEMMPDIMEMSRSVLYGKRGGQYIGDALKDAVVVVENRRLKSALMKLRNDLDAGKSLDICLDELELGFDNGEISSFCTVIKSLQSTGQVDEALKTLESSIEREQVSVNKRRCMILEQKTMMYVIFIAMDILAMILYCIIMKLLELQIGF